MRGGGLASTSAASRATSPEVQVAACIRSVNADGAPSASDDASRAQAHSRRASCRAAGRLEIRATGAGRHRELRHEALANFDDDFLA